MERELALKKAESLVSQTTPVIGGFSFMVNRALATEAYSMTFILYAQAEWSRRAMVARLALVEAGDWSEHEAAFWIEEAHARANLGNKSQLYSSEIVDRAYAARKAFRERAEYALHMAAG
ncbi:hypothetical protein CcrColossus_gp376 [Caulobacter phage CcrColossus]|uniref:Uncharacterized protein n=1 Tax=Caulobacter phage CcrColossus TaxID=1211640 RepID=K4JSX6_9CAUD|nr:hypothetical protein CcrColossus_gp376 [Caulobacter phage CcrColossus]AFU88246.1 hypothetical protein CcrColossus_gp376 [Caulobacter phage CcrColossus]